MDYKEPIRFLNELAGRNFDWTNKSTQRFLRGRYDEGRTLEDIKKVIEWKCEDWGDTVMAKYLRPSTLFRRVNFENYINEVDFADMKNDKITNFKELK